MTATDAVRTLAFGDIDSGTWGVMLAGATTYLALATPESSHATADFSITADPDSDSWRISADGAEVVVSGIGEPARTETDDAFGQLCRARVRFADDGPEHEVESLGIRGTRSAEARGQLDSAREVLAWFDPSDGVAVRALRPRKASGHAGDALTATVFEEEGPLAVDEPRLSTTYGTDQSPVRVGLELWIGAEDDAEQFARRIAGEAAGPRLRAEQDGWQLNATLLRCHSRGRDGTGVYLLLRPA